LQGFREGLDEQLRDIALERGAHLVATQAGVENMVGARSVIPQMARGRVEAVEGVRVAHPMTALPVIYEKDGRKTAIFLAVVDSIGWPETLVAGRLPEGDGEVLVDRSLASVFELHPGDDLTIAGYDFEIAGIAEPTAALWTSFAFSNYDSLIEFYFESDLADDLSAFPLLSYLLIRVEPGARREAVRDAIEAAVPDVDVFTPEELARNDAALGETMLGAVLTILVGVAYAAGLLVVALFMFTTAEGRRRDLGVLKAIGFSNRAILVAVAGEAALLTVLAVPAGIALAEGVAAGVAATIPMYLILPTEPGPLVQAILACAGFALLGATAPLRFIRKLDPAEVFRS
ncbi:MAG TPA: ABC transporter permease, partial [Longimicrobiales bacterium]|nr:ABC transporter permease [Longimicrobiales bacterium]